MDTKNTLPPQSTDSGAQRPSPSGIVFFLLILLTGLFLRVQHLRTESVWWDEFATVAFLDPPEAWRLSPHYELWNQQVVRHSECTLKGFFQQNQLLDPAAMPLYLLLEYAWNQYVYASPLSLRILSVLFGLMLLPLLYLTGKKLFDTRAGLIAMACVSLSPIHVQFAKEIRMYGLMTVLALLSVYAFIQALEDGKKRWWALTLIATFLLSWTHPFALLLPFVQGLFWLLSRPRDMKRLILWSVAVCLMVFPAAFYVITIQFWGQDSTDQWLRMPSFLEVMNDIFADDALGATFQLKESPLTFSRLLGRSAAKLLVSNHLIAAWLFLFSSLLASLLLLTRYLRSLFRSKQSESDHSPSSREPWNLFLILWLVVPPLMLYFLSLGWRPCHQPRYTLHASLALYLIYGGVITLLARKWLRQLLVAMLILFFGYQQLLVIGEPQHPDWYGAASHIRENMRNDDLILAYNSTWKRVFAYNLGPVPNVITYGAESAILADQSAFFLDLQSLSRLDNCPRDLWIVIVTDYYESGPDRVLNAALNERGIPFTMKEFGGIQHVLVYHLRADQHQAGTYAPSPEIPVEAAEDYAFMATEFWKQQEFEIAVAAAANGARIDPEYAQAWALMGMSYKEMNRIDEALEAFDRAISVSPVTFPWNHLNRSELLLRKGRYDEALQAAEKGAELLPHDYLALILQGRANIGLGNLDQAQAFLDAAREQGPDGLLIQQAMDELKTAQEKGTP
jgi:tetratricopeptide (TPR) repeat protein/uncharacterized membrane protein